MTYSADIYLRERVPADIYDTIIKLRKIREKWEVKDVISSNLWPNQQELVNFERNYGDALNDFDLYGRQNKKRIKKRGNKKKSEMSSKDKTVMSEQTSVYSMTNIRESYARDNDTTTYSDECSRDKKVLKTDASAIEDTGKKEEGVNQDITDTQETKKRYRKKKSDLILAKNAEWSEQTKKKGDRVTFKLSNDKSNNDQLDKASDTISNLISKENMMNTLNHCTSNGTIGVHDGRRHYEKYNMRQISAMSDSEKQLLN